MKPTSTNPLAQIRAARGESQQELATRLGITAAYVSLLERGRVPLSGLDREARHILLGFAQAVSHPAPELEEWIAEQRAEFEARPLGASTCKETR